MKLHHILCFFILVGFLTGSVGSAIKPSMLRSTNPQGGGLSADVNVTVRIQKIRALDKNDVQVWKKSYIEKGSDPSLFVKIVLNSIEFTSPVWSETKYIYAPNFSATVTIPVDQEFVTVQIQLWDHSPSGDNLCDIGNATDDVTITYSVKTGHWTGDDYLGDASGYGRLNGCDDGSIYGGRRDAELWFDITQSDTAGDGVPAWMKENVYHLDPMQNYSNYDPNGDGLPLPWDWKWGYDPFATDGHNALDPDKDGLNNRKEYMTSQWGSDPFCKDLFIELDRMMPGPHGEQSIFPNSSKELLYTAFDRYNVVYHLDDGSWSGTGSDMIPFDDSTDGDELGDIYTHYFLHDDTHNWRRGVFHYGVLIYHQSDILGSTFRPDAYQISSAGMEKKLKIPIMNRTVAYASVYMHELGHTLGLHPIPGHDQFSGFPWQLGWWINRPYKSCMNYGYVYYTVDYSNGSRPFNDYDDWQRMDLTYFLHS